MFDIRQDVMDESGEVNHEQFEQYCDRLVEAFAESPEGQTVVERFGNVGWVGVFLDYGMNYTGVTPADMTVGDFTEVVFSLFPRKVSVEAQRAEQIVDELTAFWQFVDRQYGLPQAEEILATLVPDGAAELERLLAEPSNYDMAKSMFMSGTQAGFDMTTEEGLNEFMLAYNASIAAEKGTSVFGPSHAAPTRSAEQRRELAKARNKRKRKLNSTNKGRKRNRK